MPEIGHDRRIVYCVSVAFLMVVAVLIVRPVKQHGIRESLFWYLKMNPAAKCNIVVAGDSRVLQGVDPASIKQALGGKLDVVNVGFRSASLERNYVDFARSLLKSDSRSDSRKVLLLGITANAFTPKSALDNGFIEQKKRGSKKPIAIPSWCILLERKLQPFAIREILNLVRGRNKAGNYETFHDDGWLEADLLPRNPVGAFALYRRRFDGNQVDQAAVKALISHVQELVESGIAVVGFEPPVPDEMQSIEATKSGFDRDAFKELFRSAGGIWLEIDRSRYVTVDGSHLAPESAQLLSRDLAMDVQHALSWKEDAK